MEIKFIGWCFDPIRNHDKVWGIGASDSGEHTTFWGRRGYELQTNSRRMTDHEAATLIRSKQSKGYQEFEKDEFDQIHEDFGKQLFIVQLRV